MIYMFKNFAVTIFLSTQNVTVLSFNDAISDFASGCSISTCYVKKSLDNKTLVLRSKSKDLDVNLIVRTLNGKFYSFNLRKDEAKAHGLVLIRDGKKDDDYRLKLKSEKFEVFEGETSIVIYALKPIRFNEQKVFKGNKVIFPKGAYFTVDGKEVSL